MLTSSSRPGPRRVAGDAGGSLILMPTAVLVVLALAAVALDHGLVYMGQRDLLDVATAAANDAATWGIDPGSLQAGGSPVLDDERARLSVLHSLAVHPLRGLDAAATTVVVDPAAGTVRVELHRHVEYVFTKALPGHREGRDVTARATAALRQR